MLIPIQGPLPYVKLNAVALPNGIAIVTVIHGTSTPYAECYRVFPNGSTSLIGRSDPAGGKVDSAEAVAFPNGDVHFFVSQADPGASGTTCQVHRSIFVGAVPAFPASNSVDQVARDQIANLKSGLVAVGST